MEKICKLNQVWMELSSNATFLWQNLCDKFQHEYGIVWGFKTNICAQFDLIVRENYWESVFILLRLLLLQVIILYKHTQVWTRCLIISIFSLPNKWLWALKIARELFFTTPTRAERKFPQKLYIKFFYQKSKNLSSCEFSRGKMLLYV